MKKPGTPKVAISAAEVSLNSERARSPGVTGFHDTGDDTISQNSFSRSTRFSPSLPAMIAALMAPIEMPAIHSGSNPDAAQRLEGAGLIGAERTAALQDQHTLRFGGCGCGRGG